MDEQLKELDRVAKMLVRRDFELLQTNDVLRIRDEQIAKEHELNRVKDEFITLVSHQLKTPLTIVKWYIDMLLSGYADYSKKKQEEYLNKIYNQTNRMIDLVDDFLNVSRMEIGTFTLQKQEVNLVEKIKTILKFFDLEISKKKLEISLNYSANNLIFMSDDKLIQIIFENIIANAVHYTPFGGRIKIGLEKRKEGILFSVADSGIGISLREHDKIFSKFFRAENARLYKTDGIGLGLYLVKMIVGKIGGEIWFESPIEIGSQKHGTAFYVLFF